jgi:diphthamide synthase (EF-2-diphthine--ammonia ligase)
VGPGFVGRSYDVGLLRDLPRNIDPCGENGEFHTFVHDGPIFNWPVEVRVGEILSRDGRYYADLLPEELAASEARVAEMIPPV